MRRLGWLFALALAACGSDGAEADDLGMPPDLLRARLDLAARDSGPEDLSATAPDLACACDTPPAAYCARDNIVTPANPGACEFDIDAGGDRCVYPNTSSNCVNGCFNGVCSAALNFLGNTFAYYGDPGVNFALDLATIPAASKVSITTQTYPPGSASDVHLVYSTDPTFATKTDVVMSYDKFTANNDQWFAVIPGQTAGTTMIWYLYADGYGLGAPLYYSNFGMNFHYTSN